MKDSLPYLTTPEHCLGCGENIAIPRHLFCPLCLESIPRTNFHFKKDNAIEQRLFGKADIEKATAFCFFERGNSIREAIHMFKYQNYGLLAKHLAYIYALELMKTNWFEDIDAIVPVPIHWLKKYKRGYNQSLLIAKGISQATGIEVSPKLIKRCRQKGSQTKKSFFDRSQIINRDIIARPKSRHKFKHILIVDDVLTSGSTIVATTQALRDIRDVKISILVIGYAK